MSFVLTSFGSVHEVTDGYADIVEAMDGPDLVELTSTATGEPVTFRAAQLLAVGEAYDSIAAASFMPATSHATIVPSEAP